MDVTEEKFGENDSGPRVATGAGQRPSGGRSYFFAGGGTGGHIYPAIAVAERIADDQPRSPITFFCSQRAIDKTILSGRGLEFITLPAVSLSVRPDMFFKFVFGFFKSFKIARTILKPAAGRAIVVATGGFVSVPVVLAARSLKIPVALINVDMVPGKANKLNARFAQQAFVHFRQTADYFKKKHVGVEVVGCPLRKEFADPQGGRVIDELGLDTGKRRLLIMGGSSGGVNINRAVCELLDSLSCFADDWQIVHITGSVNYDETLKGYGDTKIKHVVREFYDDMAGLMSVCDLAVGRAGAVSVAEYEASWLPVICVPYPYHRDNHQTLNAERLVQRGSGVIVADEKNDELTAKSLSKRLLKLMGDDTLREKMSKAAKESARENAAELIADQLGGIS